MARPAFMPTAEQRRLVLNMSGIGCTEAEILQCVPWGLADGALIDGKTLRKHFRAELDRGHALDGMRVRRSLHDLITAGNVAATIFYCKVRLGMKETSVVETTGKDGGPLPAMPTALLYLPSKDDSLPPDSHPSVLHSAVLEPCRAPMRPALPLPAPVAAQSGPEPRQAPPEPSARAYGTTRPSDRFFPRAADPR